MRGPGRIAGLLSAAAANHDGTTAAGIALGVPAEVPFGLLLATIERGLKAAAAAGHWVCLQNCHLARSWLPTLERLVAELQSAGDDKLQPGFRLWLTCLPTRDFPVSILQQSVKITMEPPKASTTCCMGACHLVALEAAGAAGCLGSRLSKGATTAGDSRSLHIILC